MKIAYYDNQACSDSRVSDLEDQANEAITDCTNVVLIGTGGTDLGFENLVLDCFIPDEREKEDCEDQIDYSRSLLEDYTQNLADQLENLYMEKESNAIIVLVGYPYISMEKAYEEDCCGFSGSNLDIIADLRALGDEIDEAQQNAIDKVHQNVTEDFVYFFGTKELFSGHEPDPNVNDENPDGWIYEWSCGLEYEENYQLNPVGHRVLGDALATYLEGLIDDGIIESPSECPTAPPNTNFPTTSAPVPVTPYPTRADEEDGCYGCSKTKSSLIKIVEQKFLHL